MIPKILAKIREANEETMELSWGCKVNIRGDKNATFIKYDGEYIYWLDVSGDACDEDSSILDKLDFKIIGHPLHIGHVLRAMRVKSSLVLFSYSDEIAIYSDIVRAKYDLTLTVEQNLNANPALVTLLAEMLNLK
jgi:hypothetical protein